MARLRSDLPALLRGAGLTVVEVSGWQTRSRPASTGGFNPVGVLNHHTGVSAKGWTKAKELAYAKWMFLVGRKDLAPPLVQISLGRSGTVYIGAAGRANHAGKAKASGSVGAGDGNSLYVGIEWMLSGTEAIPANMMKAGVTLNAVLTKQVTKTSTKAISCHFNTSVTGKWDIGDPNGVTFGNKRVLDVPKFRRAVDAERHRLYDTPALIPAPAPAKRAFIRVATNNIMSLPPNPHYKDTLAAAPHASVVLLQESDRPEVHSYLRSGSMPRKTASVPNGNTFAEFVLFDPVVWSHVSTEFFLAYKGVAHISLTRHIAVTVLHHKSLNQQFAFISYHAVTAGADRIRALLRGEGDAAVRRQLTRFRNQGIPIILGADLNRTGKVFLSASLHAKHRIDHLLGWNGKHVALSQSSSHTIQTASDHDTLVAEYIATAK